MPIIVGIDGTGGGMKPGEERDTRYDNDFRESFVNRICRRAGTRQYNRGPVLLGGGLNEAVSSGFGFIRAQKRINSGAPVLLTGYSRGGLGVISIAKRLLFFGIRVEAMLLFDAVDRYLFEDGMFIPPNVKNVLHLRRHRRARSRESFSNTGLFHTPFVTNYDSHFFVCTHGGMGGTPWRDNSKAGNEIIDEGGVDGRTTITYDEDARVSETVWQYAQPFINTHGF